MTDGPTGRCPSFRAQVLAILSLAARQKANQFSIFRPSVKGLRNATPSKKDRRVFLPLVVGVLIVGVSFNTCYQAVHGLARHAEGRWPTPLASEGPIEVSSYEYMVLGMLPEKPADLREGAAGHGTGDGDRRSRIDSLAQAIEFRRSIDDLAAREKARSFIAHLDEYGMEGFVRKEADSPYEPVDLGSLSAEAGTWLGRVLALVFVCLFVGITLLPLSTRAKDLGSLDANLGWLYCLPLSGRDILSGRFLSMTFLRPVAWAGF